MIKIVVKSLLLSAVLFTSIEAKNSMQGAVKLLESFDSEVLGVSVKKPSSSEAIEEMDAAQQLIAVSKEPNFNETTAYNIFGALEDPLTWKDLQSKVRQGIDSEKQTMPQIKARLVVDTLANDLLSIKKLYQSLTTDSNQSDKVKGGAFLKFLSGSYESRDYEMDNLIGQILSYLLKSAQDPDDLEMFIRSAIDRSNDEESYYYFNLNLEQWKSILGVDRLETLLPEIFTLDHLNLYMHKEGDDFKFLYDAALELIETINKPHWILCSFSRDRALLHQFLDKFPDTEGNENYKWEAVAHGIWYSILDNQKKETSKLGELYLESSNKALSLPYHFERNFNEFELSQIYDYFYSLTEIEKSSYFCKVLYQISPYLGKSDKTASLIASLVQMETIDASERLILESYQAKLLLKSGNLELVVPRFIEFLTKEEWSGLEREHALDVAIKLVQLGRLKGEPSWIEAGKSYILEEHIVHELKDFESYNVANAIDQIVELEFFVEAEEVIQKTILKILKEAKINRHLNFYSLSELALLLIDVYYSTARYEDVVYLLDYSWLWSTSTHIRRNFYVHGNWRDSSMVIWDVESTAKTTDYFYLKKGNTIQGAAN